MPKSKKPKAKRAGVKRAGANPAQKPAWYQSFNGTAGQHGERPVQAGKKAKNKSA